MNCEMQADVRGQVVLVTGRGLGRVFAQTLAAAGAAIAVLARSADQVAETVSVIEAAGGRALALAVDVTDQQAVERAVAEVQRRLGPVDLLVNNAGVGGPLGPLWEVDPEEWWRTIDINLRGTFLCTRAVLPGMIARRRGRIINLASHAGAYRWPLVSAYATAKAAIIKLTENLAAETKRSDIAVFAVHPSLVTIGPTERALAVEVPAEAAAARPVLWLRQEVTAGHAVAPERSARLVLFLASGRADALSGRYLTVHDDVATFPISLPGLTRAAALRYAAAAGAWSRPAASDMRCLCRPVIHAYPVN